MSRNHNGFTDALNQLNTVIDVTQNVQIDVLKEAAEYFVAKMKTRIPVSKRNKKHLRDALKVVVKGDKVQVIFEDDAWYWYLVEHGHRVGPTRKKVRGVHFVKNTLDVESANISRILTTQIINRLAG